MVKPFSSEPLWVRGEFPTGVGSNGVSIRWTQKLYYGTYTHTARFIVPLVQDPAHAARKMSEVDIAAWCSDNIARRYRKREGMHRKNSECSIYCGKDEYLQLTAEFGKYLVEQGMPFDDRAAEYLQQGIELELRDHLFYNKYRYSVKMYIHDFERFDVLNWAIDNMGVDKERYSVSHGHIHPFFYVRDEMELMQLRMALGEYIKGTTRIYLEDEVVKLIQ